ncbi:hypothetical protein SVAN01_07624 [Stagonosporopsis vannaccii]|nr:hypothetical protein SVAN01_07624 [Stagonosporopsis vannaccii]
MHLIAWLCLLGGLVARAAPLSKEKALEVRENENIHITTGEPARDRTVFVVVAIFCSTVLAFLLGSRIHRLKRAIRSRRNLMSPLLLALYITVICYIVVSAALVSGQGLYTYELCDAGTWVCLMFYIMAKGWVYAFLVERVHVVRAPFVRRSQDKVYMACMIPAMAMYAAISLNSYFWRVTAMHDSDGRCHFGITSQASIPILTVNVLTNVFLTGVFFYLLRPVIKFHGVSTVSAGLTRRSKSKTDTTVVQPARNDSAVQRNIRILLWKSIVGAILIELPVAANMIQFLVTGGKELGMMCLAFCMADAFWDALVIHWLTFGSSAEAEKDLLRSTEGSRQALTRQQESVSSRCSSRREMREAGVQAPESAFIHTPSLECVTRADSARPFLMLPR